jgi:hypothetical protein
MVNITETLDLSQSELLALLVDCFVVGDEGILLLQDSNTLTEIV